MSVDKTTYCDSACNPSIIHREMLIWLQLDNQFLNSMSECSDRDVLSFINTSFCRVGRIISLYFKL